VDFAFFFCPIGRADAWSNFAVRANFEKTFADTWGNASVRNGSPDHESPGPDASRSARVVVKTRDYLLLPGFVT
jgi:hypothetical protein